MIVEKNNSKLCNFCLNSKFDKDQGQLCKHGIETKNIKEACVQFSEDKAEKDKYIYGLRTYRKINDSENIYHFPVQANDDSYDLEKYSFNENIFKSKWFWGFLLLNISFLIELVLNNLTNVNVYIIILYAALNLIFVTYFIYRYWYLKPLIFLTKTGIQVRKDFIEWQKINRSYIRQKRKPRTEIYNFSIGFYDYFLKIDTYGETYIFKITQIRRSINSLLTYIDSFRKSSV